MPLLRSSRQSLTAIGVPGSILPIPSKEQLRQATQSYRADQNGHTDYVPAIRTKRMFGLQTSAICSISPSVRTGPEAVECSCCGNNNAFAEGNGSSAAAVSAHAHTKNSAYRTLMLS